MIHYNVAHCIEVYRQKAGFRRLITDGEIKALKAKHKADLSGRGCYVYTRKAAKGEVPFYIGMAKTQPFLKEVFTPHKLGKVKDEIAASLKGVIRLYLIELSGTSSKALDSIPEVERYLIGVALEANPKLRNLKTEQSKAWSIAGLIRSGQGKPSGKAVSLRGALKV